ncbi:hypothetical protein CCP1ISM_1030002 [Azospirillaceae bacterium]
MKARIGNIVQASGHIILANYPLIQRASKSEKLRKLWFQTAVSQNKGGAGSRRNSYLTPDDKIAANQTEIGIELFSFVPETVQCSLLTDYGCLWATLNESDLISSAISLTLKHGSVISGNWTVVGIVDALQGKFDITPEFIKDMPLIYENEMSGAVAHMAQVFSEVIGRPRTAYGITPLLIFRKIESVSDA